MESVRFMSKAISTRSPISAATSFHTGHRCHPKKSDHNYVASKKEREDHQPNSRIKPRGEEFESDKKYYPGHAKDADHLDIWAKRKKMRAMFC